MTKKDALKTRKLRQIVISIIKKRR